MIATALFSLALVTTLAVMTKFALDGVPVE
jgi:hypothetical protein